MESISIKTPGACYTVRILFSEYPNRMYIPAGIAGNENDHYFDKSQWEKKVKYSQC